MKIYVIDNDRKIKKVRAQLEQNFSVESKENCQFKMTKNDIVLISDSTKLDGVEKLKNIIFLTNQHDSKNIWHLANDYKTIDIMDINVEEQYIAERIQRVLRRDV